MKLNFVKCKTIKQMTAEQADGESSVIKEMIINYHLKTCSECKAWSVQNEKAEEFLTESLDNIMKKIEMPQDLYARIEAKIPPEKEINNVKPVYTRTDVIRPVKGPVSRLAFGFASVIISLLLLGNIYNEIVKFNDYDMHSLLLEKR